MQVTFGDYCLDLGTRQLLQPSTFVTDANLAVLVAELRRALHDRPRAPRFVRTVHRFGYAFCGQIAGAVDVSAPTRACWVV